VVTGIGTYTLGYSIPFFVYSSIGDRLDNSKQEADTLSIKDRVSAFIQLYMVQLKGIEPMISCLFIFP
jgi:hypothetical protein